MSLITCKECTKEVSDHAAACPHCGAPIKSTGIAPCKQCNTPLIAVTQAKKSSIVGILGVFGFLFGVLVALFNAVIGILIMIAAMIGSALLRGKETLLKCPACGAERRI